MISLRGLIVLAAFIAALFFSFSALAHWKPEYASVPQEIRDWYESRTLTPAAEARIHFHSCCAHSDVVKTKFKVGGTGDDEWYWLDSTDKWQKVPDDIIHWDEHAPGGDPVMFAVGGMPVCFFPPQGGI